MSRTNNHQWSRHHFCQCLFSHRLDAPSDRRPPRSPLREENTLFWFCKPASALLPSPNPVAAVTQPQHRLSFSTVMLHDVCSNILLRDSWSWHLLCSCSRVAPVLGTAAATGLALLSPQEWRDPAHSRHPALQHKCIRKMTDDYFFSFKKCISFCNSIFRRKNIIGQIFF